MFAKGASKTLGSARTRDGTDLDLRESKSGVLSGVDHVALAWG